MNTQFKDFFAFNKKERNGIIVLLLIIVALMFVPRIIPLFKKQEKIDFSSFEKEIAAFEKSQKEIKSYSRENKYDDGIDFTNTDYSIAASKLNPFPFNPNDMTNEQWEELGLTERQIKTINKYMAKGGKFYKKEDFKKLYCISENEYNILAPYIQIPDKKNAFEKKETKPENKFEKKNSKIVELNSADTTDLKTLKGIGSYYAMKIAKYRTSLGGFYEPEQLMEIKGIDSERYNKFSQNVVVNSNLVNKINVNTATFDQLKAHPYIGYNIALSLTNYRKQHGNFKSVSDIKNSALITEAVYQKISPYLKAE